jgi:hypothetical protein
MPVFPGFLTTYVVKRALSDTWSVYRLSLDGEYLFFKSAFKPRVDGFSEEWAWRVRIRDRKVEPVSNLQQMRVTGWGWFAAAPNNSFVTAVDASIQEIFALDWKAR